MNGKGLPSDMHRCSRRWRPSSHVRIDGIAGTVTKILVGRGGRRRLPQQSARGSQQGWTAQDGSRPPTNSQNDRNLDYIRNKGRTGTLVQCTDQIGSRKKCVESRNGVADRLSSRKAVTKHQKVKREKQVPRKNRQMRRWRQKP